MLYGTYHTPIRDKKKFGLSTEKFDIFSLNIEHLIKYINNAYIHICISFFKKMQYIQKKLYCILFAFPEILNLLEKFSLLLNKI